MEDITHRSSLRRSPGAFLPASRPARFLAICLAAGTLAGTAGESSTVFRAEKLAEIDASIQKSIQEKNTPGAVLWIEREGVAYHRAYGLRAAVPKPETATEDTIYDAASLTKVVATTPCIMLLIERGRIDLDAPAVTYLPEFKGHGKERITIRHLLTHTSGLRPGLGGSPPWSGMDQAIQLACAQELLNPPGTHFRYSDINFIVLGEIVRRVSGQSLNEFAHAEIFAPLKMLDTGFLPERELIPRIAPTERVDSTMLRGRVHDPTSRRMGGVAGHAGVFTTASDLARYARMHLNQGFLEGVRIFKPETVRLMTTVQSPSGLADRRGLGWDIDSGYSRPRGKVFPRGSFGHTGWTGTCLWIDPFSGTFWIFLSNRVHPNGEGNVLPLEAALGTLVAESVADFNFIYVPGALRGLPPIAKAGPSAGQSTKSPQTPVLNGIDVLEKEKFKPLKGLRLGLITNQTGTDRQRRSTIDLLRDAPGVKLKVLFSPEHGLRGVQDERVGDSVDTATGLPIYSLYGENRRPNPEQLEKLDALVFDIQDIGCRFYTYITTLGYCLEAASQAHLKFFVLDRVNPINGMTIEGPLLTAPPSFTGYHPIPVRHSLTAGELARLYQADRHLEAELTVIPVEGWNRSLYYDETGLPWINPSPNMRSLTEAILYPGIGLLEMTALSVGRGTGTPFEVVGAPYIDDVRLAEALNQLALPGVRFVPIRFTPTASTFKGQACAGVNILLVDRASCRSVDVGLAIARTLHALYPAQFNVEKLNVLLGDKPTLEAVKAGRSLDELHALWSAGLTEFQTRRLKCLLYPE